MTPAVFECEAVLFDMDGTIVDSRQLVERMWTIWARENGLPVEAALAVAHGRRTLETMQLIAPHLATPEEAERLDLREARVAEQEGGETAIPGARELLSSLPPDRWAVVTSALRAIAHDRILRVGLPAPQVLVAADDVAHGKPSPEGYLRAADRMGVDVRRSVVLEDTPAGIEAARAAGARVIGLLTTYSDLPACDAFVRDLRDVRLSPHRRQGLLELIVQPNSSVENDLRL